MTFQDVISMDLDDDVTILATHVDPVSADIAYFTPLEWQVIALAERDTLSSIHAPSRLAMAMGSLFGGHMNASLADPRLETLRRVAVDIWHDQEPGHEEYLDFIDAGFSDDQFLLLWQSIDRRRPTFRPAALSVLLSGLTRTGATAHMPLQSVR